MTHAAHQQASPLGLGDPSLSPLGRLARPVVLIILDGWGVAPPGPGNAIRLARTPVYDALVERGAYGTLEASGPAVGLPPGQMGNSEVGHLTIGSGRITPQDLVRIDESVADGSFFVSPALTQLCAKVVGRGSRLHLMGLLSDGGVHSELAHLQAMIELAARNGVRDLVVHAFLDGRDTPPQSAEKYLRAAEATMHEHGIGRYGVLAGRFYAMDRDLRWERIKAAYDALVYGKGFFAADAFAALSAAYKRGETDEFVRPTIVAPEHDARIRDGDGCLFFNFRADRARELTRAFFDRGFTEFDRGPHPPSVDFVTMTRYKQDFPLPTVFAPERPRHILAELLAERGLRQLHIAETEKYAHVTFFFNGGVEAKFAGEDRVLVPSRRDVPTYDLKPEMSACTVADKLAEAVLGEEYAFVVANFANTDMVGHSGVVSATVAAVEAVDECLGRVLDAVERVGGVCMIIADHGNAEYLLDADGEPNTAHTTNPVPVVVSVEGMRIRPGGGLRDVAPTILALLGLPQPPEMTGASLLESSPRL